MENHHCKNLIFLQTELDYLSEELVKNNEELGKNNEEFIIDIEENDFYKENCPNEWKFCQNIEKKSNSDFVNMVSLALEKAVYRRVNRLKGTIGVLFSGGLDQS